MGHYSKSVGQLPCVSVIIPVRNEEEHIEQCLTSVLAQDYPPDKLEIIVVDGLSDDNTREIATRVLEDNGPLDWRILTNPEQATPAGLNQGICDSSGEMIMRLDGHSRIAPDYITSCVETVRRTGAWCVGGAARPIGTGFVGRAIALAHLTRFGLGAAKFRNPSTHGEVDTLWPGFWPRWVFDQIGFFSEALSRNQDIELSSRIRQHGGALHLDPSIRIWYRCRQSLLALAKQSFRNGMWNILTYRQNPASLALRHFVPLAFVVSLACALGIALLVPAGKYLLFALLAAYLVGLVGAIIPLAQKHGWRYALILPIVIVAAHLSYGFGSIWGIARAAMSRSPQSTPVW